MLLKNIILAGSATLTPIFLTSILDANPSLYLYDKFIATEHRRAETLAGKRIWITGASSGIGAELAKELSHHGAHLVLSARNEEKLNEVAEECREIQSVCEKNKRRKWSPSRLFNTNELIEIEKRNTIHTIPMDVTASLEEIQSKVKCASKCFKDNDMDILVLNAGRGQLSPALLTDPSSTRELMDINYHAPVNLALSVIQQNSWKTNKNKRQRGHIVVTSSVAAKLGTPLSSSYAGTKHAIHGFFSSLRSECDDWLRIDLPCPGPVSTNLSATAFKNTHHKNKRKEENISSTIQNKESETFISKSSNASDEKKMSAERCAHLIVSSMIGPSSLFFETWIAEQPTLGVLYLTQFFPGIGNSLLGFVGKVRGRAWEEGLPLYETKGLIEAWKMVKRDNDK